jgi:hypothetical protein
MNAFEFQAAPPIPVTIGGREYLLTPLRYRDHAEAARRMRLDWPSPRAVVRRMGRGLPPDQQRHLLELVYREERRGSQVELADVLRWYRTPQGLVFHKWLMLRTHQPELSLADVDELLTQAALDEQNLSLGIPPEEANGLPVGNA